LLKGWKPGDPMPDKCFDEDEITSLGTTLKRLLYSPWPLRKRLQELGVTVTPANFYSEIPTIEDVEASFHAAARPSYDAIFDHKEMLSFLSELHEFSAEFDPPLVAPQGQFSWRGGQYSYSDAMSYYCMVRRIKPNRIVEIGSGWSTMVAHMAMVRNGGGRIVCVEPFPPDFLASLPLATEIVPRPAQQLDLEFFNHRLRDGDVLFIDSTHTVKHVSDCLHLYLHILPRLTSDLMIHAHDIYLPQTLPKQLMLDRQIYWTEQYLLYAYLLNNPRTKVGYGSAWHKQNNPAALDAFMHGRFPSGGAAFWFVIVRSGSGRHHA
jgi:methyltransferase family protein